MKLKYNPQDVVKAIETRLPVVEEEYAQAQKSLDEWIDWVKDVHSHIDKVLDNVVVTKEKVLVKRGVLWCDDIYDTKTNIIWDEDLINSHDNVCFVGKQNDQTMIVDIVRDREIAADYVNRQPYPSIFYYWHDVGSKWLDEENTYIRVYSVTPIKHYQPNTGSISWDYSKLKSILESCKTSAKEVYFMGEEMELFKRNGIAL